MMLPEQIDGKKATTPKFPLWLLLVIITLLVLTAYIILQNTKDSNINSNTTEFSYKF